MISVFREGDSWLLDNGFADCCVASCAEAEEDRFPFSDQFLQNSLRLHDDVPSTTHGYNMTGNLFNSSTTQSTFFRAAKDIRHIDQLSDIARSFSVWKLILLSTGLNYWLYIDAHRIMESRWTTQTNITNNSPFMFWIAKYCCLLLLYTLNNCTNQL